MSYLDRKYERELGRKIGEALNEKDDRITTLEFKLGCAANIVDQLLIAFGHYDNGPTRAARSWLKLVWDTQETKSP